LDETKLSALKRGLCATDHGTEVASIWHSALEVPSLFKEGKWDEVIFKGAHAGNEGAFMIYESISKKH